MKGQSRASQQERLYRIYQGRRAPLRWQLLSVGDPILFLVEAGTNYIESVHQSMEAGSPWIEGQRHRSLAPLSLHFAPPLRGQ